jgi:hypothetical protein
MNISLRNLRDLRNPPQVRIEQSIRMGFIPERERVVTEEGGVSNNGSSEKV